MHIGMGCFRISALSLSPLAGCAGERDKRRMQMPLTKTIECRVMTLRASSDRWIGGPGRPSRRGRTCFQGTARDVVAGDGGGRLYERRTVGMKCRSNLTTFPLGWAVNALWFFFRFRP